MRAIAEFTKTTLIGGILSTILVAMNYSSGLIELFNRMILLSTLSTLVPYVFCSLAVWLLPGRPAPSGAAAVVAVLAFLYAMLAIVGAGAETVFYGFVLLLAGLPMFVWLRRAGAGAS